MDISETNRDACKAFIYAVTRERVFQREGLEHLSQNNPWIFDYKNVLLEPEFLDRLSTLFLSQIQEQFLRVQVGGLESGAIPIITGVVAKAYRDKYPCTGFFIRKSRKKTGRLTDIEGTLGDDPIVLVDDILHSGKSIEKQIVSIEAFGKKVSAVFCIIRFHEESYYTSLMERGIKIHTIFTLEDFKDLLGESPLDMLQHQKPVPQRRTPLWVFRDSKPHYELVIPKSAPHIHNQKLFFGSDSGSFFCLDARTGVIVWKYKIVFGSKRKMILSSPCTLGDLVFFGAYDGNFYALNIETGERTWVFLEADWIGSSPCISEKHRLVYVGLEFGLWKKKGGLVALDAETGKKQWHYYEMGDFTHGSPAVSDTCNVVVCGCNDGFMYGFDAQNGTLLWKYETNGAVKGSCAFDHKKGIVFFGSFDHWIYALDIHTGACLWKFETNEAIYATPLFFEGKIYCGSLDKHIYCLSAYTGEKIWTYATSGRVFASPVCIQNQICIGSNDGRMYMFDPHTGENKEFYQVAERITNAVAYDASHNVIFLPTYANELFALQEKASEIKHDAE